MACSNKSCSGCTGCNNFGVLNSVVGPLTHCGCGCGCGGGRPPHYPDFPFYTGPCGPCVYDDTCAGRKCRKYWGWSNGWNGWSNCSSKWNNWGNGCGSCSSGCCNATVSRCASRLCSTSAHFTAGGPLLVSGGDAVELTPAVVNHDCFMCTEHGILIRYPGTYMAIHTTHVPAMQTLSTRMFLTLNGEIIDGSCQDVAVQADGTTNASPAHLIFHALPNSLLRLVSSEDISLTGCSESTDIFKLTLVKLG